MAIAVAPSRLRRYKDLARLLLKYGPDLVQGSGLDELAGQEDAAPGLPPDAVALAADLERMGPTYVKLGQLLSTRTDLIPADYAEALSRLQDAVEPMPFDAVQRVLFEDLGDRRRMIESIDPVPLASASLGQVHRGVLADGRRVAIKVQRPEAAEAVAEDMAVLLDIAGLLDRHTEAGHRYGVLPLVEHFEGTITAELDYRREAANLVALGGILERYPRLAVPQPVDGLVSERALVMDLVEGRRVGDGPGPEDGAALAEDVFRAYLDQILIEGFFHADPHPGNVLLLADGRLALVDLGMVATVAPAARDQLVRLLLAVTDGDARRAAAAVAALGRPLDDFDEGAFTRSVARLLDENRHRTLEQLEAGGVVLALSKASFDAGLRPAPELAMLGKALMNLDQVTRALDRSFDPTAALADHARDVLEASLRPSGASLMSAALETKEFLEQLPGRVNRVLDSAASGQFEVKVRAFDEAELLRGLQKLANRVTMGLVLAALILGAALLMRVPTSSTLFGYPSLAIACFLAAAIGAAVLLGSIVLNDRGTNRRHRRRS